MSQLPVLISLFLVIFVGFLAYRFKVFSQETAQHFNKFVFYFSVPAIIFLSIIDLDKSRLVTYPKFLLINVFALFLFFIVIYFALKITKLSREARGSILYTSLGANIVYFGYPILLSVFPKEHFSLGVIYSIAAITIGDLTCLFLLEIDKNNNSFNLKKNLIEYAKNPIVISSLLGFIALLLNIHLPKFLSSSLEILGKPTTALGLFSIGIYFGRHLDYKKINLSFIPAFIKLIIFPLVVYFLTFKLFKLDLVAAQTSVVMATMPTAIFSIVVADIYDLDKTLTSNTVILTSVLFMLTLPLWIWLIV